MGIACSGYRIAEAMDLKETDIHWEHGDINIKFILNVTHAMMQWEIKTIISAVV